jgi:hypothetical protein
MDDIVDSFGGMEKEKNMYKYFVEELWVEDIPFCC